MLGTFRFFKVDSHRWITVNRFPGRSVIVNVFLCLIHLLVYLLPVGSFGSSILANFTRSEINNKPEFRDLNRVVQIWASAVGGNLSHQRKTAPLSQFNVENRLYSQEYFTPNKSVYPLSNLSHIHFNVVTCGSVSCSDGSNLIFWWYSSRILQWWSALTQHLPPSSVFRLCCAVVS